MRCDRCGRNVKEYHQGGALYVSNGGYCKECAERLDKIDLELLNAIITGEDISKFLQYR